MRAGVSTAKRTAIAPRSFCTRPRAETSTALMSTAPLSEGSAGRSSRIVDSARIVAVAPPTNGSHLYGAVTVTLIGSPTRPVVPVEGFARKVMQTCAGDETDPVPLRNSVVSACCWIQCARPSAWLGRAADHRGRARALVGEVVRVQPVVQRLRKVDQREHEQTENRDDERELDRRLATLVA